MVAKKLEKIKKTKRTTELATMGEAIRKVNTIREYRQSRPSIRALVLCLLRTQVVKEDGGEENSPPVVSLLAIVM